MDVVDTQTYEEEVLNTITHGLGLVISIPAVFAMVKLAKMHGNKYHVWGCLVYGLSLIAMYLFSSIYHLSGVIALGPELQTFLRDLDHAAVYILIAGTYTPITLINLINNNIDKVKNTIPKDHKQIMDHLHIQSSFLYKYSPHIGWLTLVLVWIMCVAGVAMKLMIGTAALPVWLSYGSHLMMGWLGVLIAKPIFWFVPKLGQKLLAIGGVVYTVGVVFLLSDSLPFNHPVWHLFVGAASSFHYICVVISSVPSCPKWNTHSSQNTSFFMRWLIQLAASKDKMMIAAKLS
eukprot:TRINITY_DN1304_c0_g1_i1.p1 TRINITY_DN1304_c0_g1~~TRINITY_DN1304_c0_g1_i1.p1  ORF type:complete len:290 (+),score=47.39 TRINITY_DN1304_c0_g1_i1:364-1233(+)